MKSDTTWTEGVEAQGEATNEVATNVVATNVVATNNGEEAEASEAVRGKIMRMANGGEAVGAGGEGSVGVKRKMERRDLDGTTSEGKE